MFGYGKSYALVVGISHYNASLRKLPAAQPGASDIAQALRQQHYEVKTLFDNEATTDGLNCVVDEFFTDRRPEDVLVFYFAGHGYPFEHDVYLAATNFNPGLVQRGLTSGFPLSALRDTYFRQTAAQNVLLILDCCYSGGFSNALPTQSDEARLRSLIKDILQGQPQGRPRPFDNKAVIAATGRYQETPDDDGSGRSPLVANLLPVLRGEPEAIRKATDRNGFLTSARLKSYLSDNWKNNNRFYQGDYAFEDLQNGTGQGLVIGYYQQSAQEAAPPQSEEDLQARYLQYICKKYGSIVLPIGLAESNISLQDNFIFQELRPLRIPSSEERPAFTAGYAISEEEENRSADQLDRTQVIDRFDNILTLLERSPQPRIILLGSTGIGKTTILKYLMNKTAQEAQVSLANHNTRNQRVPIFISLPDLVRSGQTIQGYLTNTLIEIRINERYVYGLRNAIDQGRAFVCLDSLDGVDPSQKSQVIKQINELASIEGNSWIVSSRFTNYPSGQFDTGQFAEWELRPMAPPLSQLLAKQLLHELQRSRRDQEGMAERTLRAFLNQLEMHPQAASWSENPLLFSLAITVFARTGKLPFSRASLCQDVINVLLYAREGNQVRCEMLRRVIADLALKFYQTKGSSFTLHDLIELLPDIREEQQENWDTEDMAYRIVTTGVLEEVAYKTYSFRHQAFQEYLVALALSRRLVSENQSQKENALSLAWERRTSSQWAEVLRLVVGVLVREQWEVGPQVVMSWLRKLIRQRYIEEGDPGNLALILALKSLCELSEIASVWEKAEMGQLEEEIVTTWAIQLFEAARRGHITMKDRLLSVAQEVTHLRASAVDMLAARLVTFLGDGSRSTREAAVEALGSLGSRAINPLIASLSDERSLIRETAVRALAKLNCSIPAEAIARLEELRQDPQAQAVRNAASEALVTIISSGRGFPEI